MCVCHTCDTPPCCNPKHLWIGTQQDNTADRTAKGRTPKGKTHANAKLTEADVLEIKRRFALGHSKHALARDFPVTRIQIIRILRGSKWKHLQP